MVRLGVHPIARSSAVFYRTNGLRSLDLRSIDSFRALKTTRSAPCTLTTTHALLPLLDNRRRSRKHFSVSRADVRAVRHNGIGLFIIINHAYRDWLDDSSDFEKYRGQQDKIPDLRSVISSALDDFTYYGNARSF